MGRADPRHLRLAGGLPRRGRRARRRLLRDMDGREDQKRPRLGRGLRQERVEPAERRHRRFGGRRPVARRGLGGGLNRPCATDMRLRAGRVVKRLGRGEDGVAVLGEPRAHEPEPVQRGLESSAEALPVHLPQRVPQGDASVEPRGKGAEGQAALGRIRLAPCRVDAEQQRFRSFVAQVEPGQFALLVGGRRIHRQIGEAAPEGAAEIRRVEQAQGRGAEHRGIVGAAARDLRIHEALVAIHQRPLRPPRPGPQPVGVEDGHKADADGAENRRHSQEQQDEAPPFRQRARRVRSRHRVSYRLSGWHHAEAVLTLPARPPIASPTPRAQPARPPAAPREPGASA